MRELRWVQLNAGLVRNSEGSALESARTLFDATGELLQHEPERCELFFFQRKSPDVRLRFHTSLKKRVFKELAASLQSARVLRSSYLSVYEPEHRQFGGKKAMRAVHEYFHADTAVWMTLDRMRRKSPKLPSAELLWAATADDLFASVLEDSSEIWDSWWNYLQLQPRESTPPGPFDFTSLQQLREQSSKRGAAQLSTLSRANIQLAEALRGLQERSRLKVGLRALIPFVAWFGANRWGLNGDLQRAIALERTEARNPKRELRGA